MPKEEVKMVEILDYRNEYELEWVKLRARVASRSHTWDFIERNKVTYENPAIELVLLEDNKIIGYIDAEIELVAGQISWESSSIGAVVQEFGVDPDYQKLGYGRLLLNELSARLLKKGILRVEFWTKDPKSVKLYQHLKFRELFCHQHFRISADEIEILKAQNKWKPIYAYMIKNTSQKIDNAIQETPLESHACYGFEWSLEK